MSERRALTYVEIDVPICSLVYGVAPCTASVPTTGADKCFNTKASCQDRTNYSETTITLRFAMPAAYLPSNIDCIPCIEGIPEHNPGRVSLGEDLGERASLKVTLRDHPHSDAGPGFDPYFASRAYNPFEQGTLFGKFRARQPYLRGAALRWKQGFLGDNLADFETRHFVIDAFDGPNEDGVFSIVAKDIIKLLDGDRAQAPAMSSGFLSANITDTDQVASILPLGIGNAEYGVSGHVCIGGNEIVAFTRDTPPGNDGDTLLLLHFEGADGGGAANGDWIDSSTHNRLATRVGSPTFEDAQKKFGATSMYSPSDDGLSYADSAEWDLTSDKTIDGWHYITTLASGDRLWSHANSSTVGYRLLVNADGSVDFTLSNTSTLVQLTAPAGTIAANTWVHYAVERYGNVWTLFINGAVASTTTTNPNASYPAVTSVFRVALGSGGSNGFIGYTDEFRISNVARYQGAAFTPKTIPYQISSDDLVITRAQLGTTASSHQAEDRVQKVLIYSEEDAADIIRDLEVNYAGVPSSYIDLAEWQAETNLFLSQVYSAVIPEPTPVKELVQELVEQAGLAHWQDDTAAALRLLVIRQVDAEAETYGASKRLSGSLALVDQPSKRISRVQVYYGLIDPTRGLNDTDNYRSVETTIDTVAEADYGNSVIKTIYSRWIPQFGGAIAGVLANNLLARYRDAPRKISWDVLRGGTVPVLGGGYRVESAFLQDAYGNSEPAPVQVTRVMAGPAIVSVEAEEMKFGTAVSTDPNNHIIVVSNNTTNFNLRDRHDSLYGEPVAGNVITCIINAGVVVSSTDSSIIAFDTGAWPAGVTVNLECNGAIKAAGGNAGKGAYAKFSSSGSVTYSVARAGQPGGTALKARYAISVDGSGTVVAGGGGGGGGGCGPSGLTSITVYGGAGGGGAGVTAGLGAATWTDKQQPGGNGTATTGGAGKAGSGSGLGAAGGNGGNNGSAGTAGGNTGTLAAWRVGGAGGAAGKAVDGDAYITEIGTVTFTGPRV